jgi:uncharacterized membrane protein YgaE (UPF0421/DUF939 family)
MAHRAARPGRAPAVVIGWADRFAGSDPGFNRLRTALLTAAAIAATLAAEWLFVRGTHALQIQAHGAVPAAQAAKAAVANHTFVVIAMLLGASMCLLNNWVIDTTAGGQLVSLLVLPGAMIPALAVGITLGPHRIPALASLAVALTAGTYGTRFGPRGASAGMAVFIGDLLGFILHSALTTGGLGWLAAEAGVGVAVSAVIRFAFFYPNQAKALRRAQRSYAARARKLAGLALELFDQPGHGQRGVRRLQGELVRLNEAALIIDARLGEPGALAEGSRAVLLHQRLFDAELALTNIARFAQAMAVSGLPEGQRAEVRRALLGIVRREAPEARRHAENLIRLLGAGPSPEPGDDRGSVVVPHRFAASIVAFTDAMEDWLNLGGAAGQAGLTHRPQVSLMGGWLPGAALVSNVASLETSGWRGGRIRLANHTRSTIQMAIAAGAALALGDQLSGQRVYWALVAVFVVFLGTSNAGEKVRKAVFRVVGTAAGIGAGSLLVAAVGQNLYVLVAVVLLALFLGLYLLRLNYTFLAFAITVAICLVYEQLGVFSRALALMRLGQTALGAAVAVAVVLLVLPLPARRVLRVAVRAQVQSISQMTRHATSHLLGENHRGDPTIRDDARAIDASYQALVAAARPVLRSPLGTPDQNTSKVLALASASRSYSRNLVADVTAAGPLDAATRLDIKAASATLQESLNAIAGALTGPGEATYTRSSALFDRAERRIERGAGAIKPAQFAVRDLELIDGTMAVMAADLGLRITDHDTAPGAAPPRPPARSRRPPREIEGPRRRS